MCQDETRVGLKTLTGKVITAPGVKPTVAVKWERENFWIYGAIEPLTGQHFQQEYPQLNGDYFQQFLDWLSQQLGSDYAILQIDQAPAHISSAINWPENIIPLLQPPHAPELNPIERLWQFLKKSLKNELFSDLQDLRTRLQQLFEQLTSEQVISISSYNFILEALFYAASY
ncbi:IS630 family transposase [Desmonostoc muscorum LEGE 12446]|uniref:IS630 family transposase n=1 Tax=Desmonostoc muscorum TaxID=1179 RepID=UPI0018EFF881|nr:IS630 family transposase [Desmonostoc muscorum]MCF2145997.1 IS630 family transposase [Desmonostoc muscorum LEGE 12446]MCF2146844.1 IS630 family transposase [Desmonostoc muscorum LEGE 12446]MCF2148284.1 IS630 family transposase [Desmonostoc muscorum LEGE 12446]MCF2150618.1 IS630 family transposase [Desmonostoc muscorum LEGE 12446]MCF2151255.1 IS630 family transposase [Desmonostoc muscorum LEGE 12446]